MSNANAMAILVGRMKVHELARMAGVGLEELVTVVLAHRGGTSARRATNDVSSRRRGSVGRSSERSPGPAGPKSSAGTPFPALGDMAGQATYRQIHFAIDRWLLGNVWEQEGHNVSRAATRLEISRRRFRELFARTRSEDPGPAVEALEGKPSAPLAGPALESLLPTGTYRTIHDGADRWLLGHVLEWTAGNLTHAARHLDVSRKHLREHLARVGMR
ncbi:helix-turn-helix domain-containing protein [Paraliomyxa miuraensis]|uniref:helix-turn-helix domain-containing protein n=1 Tax=Paraliomyxa miuraensis TaxID=376150 RepID=UPI00225509FA|nr:helix-turn-helix domain-containing protein [Paraliomyxa miuraensis]MCX4241990.1 hypothetical protein [Paraliomyxa miuraensis]